MRMRTGHNPEDWTKNEPARAHMPGHGGQLVVGDSGVPRKQVRNPTRSLMARQYNERRRIEG